MAHLDGRKQNDFVFEGPDGGSLRHSNWYPRHYKPAVTRAGLPRETRFHDLRHTYAAFLIAEGAHPRAIMERMATRRSTSPSEPTATCSRQSMHNSTTRSHDASTEQRHPDRQP